MVVARPVALSKTAMPALPTSQPTNPVGEVAAGLAEWVMTVILGGSLRLSAGVVERPLQLTRRDGKRATDRDDDGRKAPLRDGPVARARHQVAT